MRGLVTTLVLLLVLSHATTEIYAQRIMEHLDRGVVAVRMDEGHVWVGWRLLGNDSEKVKFNVYRQAGEGNLIKLNPSPLAGPTDLVDAVIGANDLARPVRYSVRPVMNGVEAPSEGSFVLPANPAVGQYLSIPLQTPAGYHPNDASAADLDGDGQYEIILHQTGRAKDNSQSGQTDPPIIQAYKLNGTLLWTVNLGRNIRDGAHYTQFMVYDFDGDGKAEMICKTSDGTIDGKGKIIGDASASYANSAGHVLTGPEFLTVFNGETGAAMDTVRYTPARTEHHPETPDLTEYKELWGDAYGNRGERYLAAVAYLDGVHASAVMCRGYYTRTCLSAWDFKDGKLIQRWLFDTGTDRKNPFYGQGHHNLSVTDVDGDGKDDIIYGDMCVGSDGKGMYSTLCGHGDTIHLGDLDPTRPGLEVFSIQERFDDAGAHMFDAGTGKILWKKPSLKAATSGGDKGEGPARGVCFDIDPRYPGSESWTAGAGVEGVWDARGNVIGNIKPPSCNFRVYWDGDLLDELLDKNQISKWNWETQKASPLLVAGECTSCNGTKATPSLSADLLGDWREEVVWPTRDGKELRIYTTTIPTAYRFRTLMHDPQYRLSVAWQNTGYNQPPHVSWDMSSGKQPAANIAFPPSPVTQRVSTEGF